jgi:hypothetical protein
MSAPERWRAIARTAICYRRSHGWPYPDDIESLVQEVANAVVSALENKESATRETEAVIRAMEARISNIEQNMAPP